MDGTLRGLADMFRPHRLSRSAVRDTLTGRRGADPAAADPMMVR
ncbi:hypothetical protein NKH18_41780 [Streptomyces sp. M10(2022)]